LDPPSNELWLDHFPLLTPTPKYSLLQPNTLLQSNTPLPPFKPQSSTLVHIQSPSVTSGLVSRPHWLPLNTPSLPTQVVSMAQGPQYLRQPINNNIIKDK
jgi:hypothetical protein